MPTQEREAMERLEAEIGRLHDAAALVATQPGSELKRTLFEGEVAAFKMALHEIQKYKTARHARSLQPITVEGLVAMGAVPHEMASGMGTVCCIGELQVKVWDDGAVSTRLEHHPCHPQPTNMAQIDDLLSR